ncbi:MAG: response regulator [Desulfovibrio sp.]|jgi:signal transduction histidine kinase/CheY-like chemotaxis protein/HPt (histidine-containing phosphotransfer) domain-containing protein|nr:response regulator [Desulfovibrio sp.]
MPLKELLRAVRYKLVLLLVLTVLSVGCSYFLVRDSILKSIAKDVHATLNLSRRVIAARLFTLSFELDLIALNFQDRLDHGATQEDLRDFARILKKQFAGSDEYSPVRPFEFLVNIRGEDLSIPDEAGHHALPAAMRLWYMQAVLDPGKAVLTEPFLCPITLKITFDISRSVRSRSGQIYGVAAFSIPIESFFNKIYQETANGSILLTSADYTVMVYRDRKLLGRKLWEIDGYATLVDKLQHGVRMPAPVTVTDSQGERSKLFLTEIFNGWHVGFSMPERIYRRDIATMTVILLFFGIATFVFTSYFILRLSVEKHRADTENRTKSLFLARMSHEIRTPLNSILGFTELLARKYVSREMREYTTIIGQAGTSLLAIISDILDFSKIESGSFELEKYEYHFSSLLNDIVNMVRIPMLEKQDINFVMRVNPAIPSILLGDEVRVRQIFYNLLSNAVKYTEKGFIQLTVDIVELHANNVMLSIQVMDTGTGIKDKDIKFIFEDFKRSTSKEHIHIEGTGLGLAITHNLCAMMGGYINVKSKYKKGSTFTAVIRQGFRENTPVARFTAASPPHILLFSDNSIEMVSLELALNDLGVIKIRKALGVQEFIDSLQNSDFDFAFVTSGQARFCMPKDGQETGKTRFVVVGKLGETVPRNAESLISPPYSITVADVLNGNAGQNTSDDETAMNFSAPTARVLVADDIYANLMVAKEFLAHFGIRADTCTTGRDAVELVMNNSYDIVFMDHMMPDMDGLEATAAIRAAGDDNAGCRDTIIIALTANAVSGQRDIFLAKGMNDFLPKPVRMNKLADMLRKWLPAEKQLHTPVCENKPKNNSSGYEIEGINCRAGLLNAGENPMVYHDILVEFCRDSAEKIPQIMESLESGDIKTYTILVHALKGTCRTIGALHTAHSAASLESSAHKGDTTFLLDNTVPFIENLGAVLRSIQEALQLEQEDDANDATDIRLFEFDRLKKALQDMDMQTVNLLLQKYSSMRLGSGQKERIAEIERCIIAFEYDEAIEKINVFIHT